MTADAPSPALDGIELVSADGLGPGGIDDVYARVLAPNFPPDELTDQKTFRACHAEASEWFPGIVAMRDGLPVGGAFGERHLPTGIVLLSYLAVVADQRGLRIGERLLSRATQAWSLPGTAAILAEVEDPLHHKDVGHGDPLARRRFYARAGARIVPISYFQPSLRPGSPRVTGMLLLSLVREQRTLDAAKLLTFLEDYVTLCEGQLSEEDLEYASMLASVTRSGPTMELVDMGEYR